MEGAREARGELLRAFAPWTDSVFCVQYDRAPVFAPVSGMLFGNYTNRKGAHTAGTCVFRDSGDSFANGIGHRQHRAALPRARARLSTSKCGTCCPWSR